MTPAFQAIKGQTYTCDKLNGALVIAEESGHVVDVRVLDSDGEIDHMVPPITVKASWLKAVEVVE